MQGGWELLPSEALERPTGAPLLKGVTSLSGIAQQLSGHDGLEHQSRLRTAGIHVDGELIGDVHIEALYADVAEHLVKVRLPHKAAFLAFEVLVAHVLHTFGEDAAGIAPF
eukprot:scaffold309517_cov31-Tisochrysis_lutea.AAC.1